MGVSAAAAAGPGGGRAIRKTEEVSLWEEGGRFRDTRFPETTESPWKPLFPPTSPHTLSRLRRALRVFQPPLELGDKG